MDLMNEYRAVREKEARGEALTPAEEALAEGVGFAAARQRALEALAGEALP